MAKVDSTAFRMIKPMMREFMESAVKSGSATKPSKQVFPTALVQAGNLEDTRPGKGTSAATFAPLGKSSVMRVPLSTQDTETSVAGEEDPGAAMDMTAGHAVAVAPDSARADGEPRSAPQR